MKSRRYLLLTALIFFTCILSGSAALAQSNRVDSANVFSLINKAEDFFTNSDYDSALFYCNKAETISKNLNFKKGQAYALIETGDILIDKDDLGKAQVTAESVSRLGAQLKDSVITAVSRMQMAQVKMYSNKFDDAIPLFEESLKYFPVSKPVKYEALAYNDLGYTWGRKGEFNKQAESLIRSVSIYEDYFPDNAGELGIALSNLSALYYSLDQKDKAISYAKRSLLYREKVGDKEKLSLGNCNLCQYYIGNDNTEAEKYLKLCIKYAQECNKEPRIIHSYVTAAHLYNTAKKPVEAFEYETRAIALLEKRKGDSAMLARRYMSAGTICRELKKDTALTSAYYSKALNILTSSNDKVSLRDLYVNMANYFSETGNYPAALASYKKYTLYKDSIISEKTQSSIAEISTRYETKKKDDEIIRLNISQRIRQLEIEKQKAVIAGNVAEARQKENAILLLSQQQELQNVKIRQQDEELEKQMLVVKSNAQQLQLSQQEKLLQQKELQVQKQWKNFIIGGSALALLLIGFMFNRYQLKKKLDRQKEMLAVRNNIAQDLHDEIGSALTSIKILSQVSKNNLQKDQQKASDMLSQITEQSAQMQQGMSDIVWAIKPDNDKLENMLIRMREYAGFALEPKNIAVSFNVDEQLLAKSLDMQQRKDVFLIFKEAVNNAAKYAEASLVEINLYKENGNILMRISDNGKGFDPEKETSSNGLKNIKARAATLGGKAKIVSEINKGTQVIVEVPAT
jgi:signal transduction histidine kinase